MNQIQTNKMKTLLTILHSICVLDLMLRQIYINYFNIPINFSSFSKYFS